MTYEDHISAARAFLLAEELLIKPQMGMTAAEAIWGAAIHVIDATNHRIGARHVSNNRDREQIVEYLENKYGLDELNSGFEVIRNRLHNHFYTGRLSYQELSQHLAAGIDFVNRMIELSEQEGA